MPQYFEIHTDHTGPLRYIDFLMLTHEFKRQCEQNFESPCSLRIDFMSSTSNAGPMPSIHTVTDYSDTSTELFDSARKTLVSIEPRIQNLQKPDALALLEFSPCAERSCVAGFVNGAQTPIFLDFGHSR